MKGLGESAKVVVEINTGTDQVRRTEVQKYLETPIRRLDLNPFEKQDRDDLRYILDHAGIPSAALELGGEGRSELRDHLIDLLNSPHVKKRLDSAIRPLLKDHEAMKVIATACVLRAFSIHAGTDFIRSVTGGDPFDVLLRNEQATFEFGALTPDELALHSAIFSEFFLRQYVGSSGIIAVICHLAFEAARRKNSRDQPNSQRTREARKALGTLLQYSRVSSLLGNSADKISNLTKLYEKMRENTTINNEPLFWLQYSIFMQDISNYGMARKHLEVAYLRAAKISGFLTYQLDTNYLKLILQAPKGEKDYPGDTEILFELIDKVREMVAAEDHRVHAIRVLQDLKVFCLNHGSALSLGERQRLSIQCLSVVSALGALDLNVRMELGTDSSKSAVEDAVTILAGLEH